jgi:hypothetical protein
LRGGRGRWCGAARVKAYYRLADGSVKLRLLEVCSWGRDIVMTFKLVCIINSVLAFGFGIAFVIAAEPTAAMYAIEGAPGLTPQGLLVTKLLGAALVGFGVVSLQARDAGDSVARRAIALGFVVGNVIAAVIAILGVTSGAVNALGWSTVAIYLLLAAAFGITGLAKSSA